MKKVMIALCFVALKATSQTVDTSINRCIAVKITPIYYTTGIPAVTDTITHLGVFDYKDDLKGNCVANWVLLNANKNILFDSYKVSEEDYKNWDSTAAGLMKIIANYLKVKFK